LIPRRLFIHQQLGSIFGRERPGALDALGPLVAAELRGWRSTAIDGVADRQEKFLLPRRQAHAEQARRLVRYVLERVRRVGGDVYGRTGAGPPWLRPAAERNQHVDQAVTAAGVLAGHEDRVGAAGGTGKDSTIDGFRPVRKTLHFANER